MAKYFLGSVGRAEAFRFANGEKRLMFVANSLTDSGINISTTKDELRGGTGAPVVANFFHDANVAITLTDVLFKNEYVEAQLGGTFNENAKSYYSDGPIAVTAGVASLTYEPQKLEMPCSNDEIVVWYSEEGKDDWHIAEGTLSEKTFTFTDTSIKGNFCFRYLTNEVAARDLIVKSNMIPQELFLVITAPLFAGDACAASEGGIAGSITFEVPRFRLDGAQDFALNMSSNTTMSLAGTAQAVATGCDINGSKLLRIIEVITGEKFGDGVKEVMLADETMSADKFTATKNVAELVAGEGVYGIKEGDKVVKIPAKELICTKISGTIVIGEDNVITTAGEAGDKIKIALDNGKFDTLTLA